MTESNRTRVGTYVLPEATVFTKHYEVAAWWSKVEVPAGEYPVYATDIAGKPTRPGERPYYLSVPLEGVCVDQYLAPLYGGVPVGPTRKDDVGKPMTHGIHVYNWQVKHSAEHGQDVSRWRLDVDPTQPLPFPEEPERDGFSDYGQGRDIRSYILGQSGVRTED